MPNSISTFSVSINDFFGEKDHLSGFALLAGVWLFPTGQTRNFQTSPACGCYFSFGWRSKHLGIVACAAVWVGVIFKSLVNSSDLARGPLALVPSSQLSGHSLRFLTWI